MVFIEYGRQSAMPTDPLIIESLKDFSGFSIQFLSNEVKVDLRTNKSQLYFYIEVHYVEGDSRKSQILRKSFKDFKRLNYTLKNTFHNKEQVLK